jgi:hypothetical protein
VGPYTLDNPTIQTVEELTDMGFTVIPTPSADDWIDIFNQVPRPYWSFAPCFLTDLLLEAPD